MGQYLAVFYPKEGSVVREDYKVGSETNISPEERFHGILILPLCEYLHGLQTIPDEVVGPLPAALDIPLPHCCVHLVLPVLN